MRFRISTREFCYTLPEFRSLSAAEICRRYGWGDEWVDAARDEAAQKELDGASQ